MPDDRLDIPADLPGKIREIEIRTRKLVDNVFSGEYHTIFKGMGMEFSEVRPYQPGDDIRSMDWNVTARAGEPFIKVFREERELTLMLVVDVSRSGVFGSESRFKVEVAAEMAAALAFSAIKNNDKVGLLAFTDRIEQAIAPKKGRAHALRLVRDILFHQPQGIGTAIGPALDYLNRIQKKKAIVFLISDFQDEGYDRSLKAAARKHDLIAVRLFDPRERELEPVGRIFTSDAETGAAMLVNTNDPAVREAYKAAFQARAVSLNKLFGSAGVDQIVIDIARPYTEPLIRFFKDREKRRRFG